MELPLSRSVTVRAEAIIVPVWYWLPPACETHIIHWRRAAYHENIIGLVTTFQLGHNFNPALKPRETLEAVPRHVVPSRSGSSRAVCQVRKE